MLREPATAPVETVRLTALAPPCWRSENEALFGGRAQRARLQFADALLEVGPVSRSTTSCGFEVQSHYHFRARIQSFQDVAASFPGDLQRSPGVDAGRSAGARKRARAKSRFCPHFVRFQGFARGKISLSVAMPMRR